MTPASLQTPIADSVPCDEWLGPNVSRDSTRCAGSRGGAHGVRSDSPATLSVVSLFAGIGGFDLGFTQAGMKVVAHVEKDANCRKLLAAKFPDAAVLDDVCTAGASNLPACDVLAGGWPCQDLSVAGKRAGLAGARSGLFYQFTRIAHELQPAILVWENVPGLLTSDDGRDMLRVVTEFQRLGFSGGWRTLDAQFLGVAQRRRRVFGVFARGDIGAGCAAEILSLHEGVRGHPAPRREAGKDVAGTLGGSSQSGGFRTTDLDNNGAFICGALTPGAHPGSYNGQDAYTGHLIAFPERMSGTQCAATEGISCVLQSSNPTAIAIQEIGKRTGTSTTDVRCGIGIAAEGDPMFTLQAGAQHGVAVRSSVRRLTPRECERLQGFPDDWTAGFSDSVRYRMLGNAVAVPVARWIGFRVAGNVAGARGGSAGERTGGPREVQAALNSPSHVIPEK